MAASNPSAKSEAVPLRAPSYRKRSEPEGCGEGGVCEANDEPNEELPRPAA